MTQRLPLNTESWAGIKRLAASEVPTVHQPNSLSLGVWVGVHVLLGGYTFCAVGV